jgi:DNA-binding MarR family transcriptional regulator
MLLVARESFFQRMEKATAGFWDASALRACAPLMPFIDVKGTRSTDLAKRMGVSKQAVGRKIKVLSDEGLIECVSDPDDGRAFLVKFTRVGMKRLADLHSAIGRVEQDLERELGAERMRVAREVLFELAYGRGKADQP